MQTRIHDIDLKGSDAVGIHALQRRLKVAVPLICLAFAAACGDATGPGGQSSPQGESDNANGSFIAVGVGDNTSCALDEAGRAYCWGSNFQGMLGTADTTYRLRVPTLVSNLPSAFKIISVGANHQCALTSEGSAYCWGGNGGGQLGMGDEQQHRSVVPVAGGLTFGSISAGGGYTCGVTTEQVAYCWGGAGNGQLGAGAAVSCNQATFLCSVDAPVPVAGALRFLQISAGRNHTCGVTIDGTGYCWGDNTDGELGDPSVPINCGAFPEHARCLRDVPNPIAGGLRFTQLAAGAFHTCGVTIAGAAYCWGIVTADSTIQAFALGNAAYTGQLGTQRGSRLPVPVAGGLTFHEVTVGNLVSCGLTIGGTAVCWGSNNYGNLGVGGADPSSTTNPLPVQMPAARRAPAIGEDDHACAATNTGRIWCWGGVNFFGEIGSEPVSEPFISYNLRAVPTPVSDPGR
jgi:alpha-tubulin suppressor-like RCC1 family protein